MLVYRFAFRLGGAPEFVVKTSTLQCNDCGMPFFNDYIGRHARMQGDNFLCMSVFSAF
jgi:hypothetical protein